MRLTEEAVLWLAVTVALILFLAALICFMLDLPVAGMSIGAFSVGIFLILGQVFKGDY